MITQTVYVPVPVEERLPDPSLGGIFIVNCYSDHNEHKSIFEQFGIFNPIEKKFSCESTFIHAVSWLEKKEGYFLTKEELEKVFHEAWYLGAKSAFERESSEERYADTDFNDWLNTQK